MQNSSHACDFFGQYLFLKWYTCTVSANLYRGYEFELMSAFGVVI